MALLQSAPSPRHQKEEKKKDKTSTFKVSKPFTQLLFVHRRSDETGAPDVRRTKEDYVAVSSYMIVLFKHNKSQMDYKERTT